MIKHPFLTFDDAGRLQSDLSCIGCGYNLRTLTKDATCPECGEAVRQTLDTMPIWLLDKQWTKQVSDGLMGYSIAIAVLAILGVLVDTRFSLPYRRTTSWAEVLFWIAALTPNVAISISLWWITTRNTFYNQTVRSLALGRLLRVLALIRPAVWWMWIAFGLTYSIYTSPRWQLDIRPYLPLVDSWREIMWVLELTTMIALLIYVKHMRVAGGRWASWVWWVALVNILILACALLALVWQGTTHPMRELEALLRAVIVLSVLAGFVLMHLTALIFGRAMRRWSCAAQNVAVE